jgi:hypothetical protein
MDNHKKVGMEIVWQKFCLQSDQQGINASAKK